jgi:hypothetical protein
MSRLDTKPIVFPAPLARTEKLVLRSKTVLIAAPKLHVTPTGAQAIELHC